MALPQRLLTLQESARCCSYLPVCVETKACEKRAQKAQDGIYISYPLQSFNFLYCGTNIISVYHDNLQAARETGALKEAKDKLEKRVEELTWRLGLEKRLRVISLLIMTLLEIW